MIEEKVIHATEDGSVNFILPASDGAFEARYVRRSEDYFIAYVSSQAGCDRACRFCHLTATGQTSMEHATAHKYAQQVERVLLHHAVQNIRPGKMNMNFMARGEPLLNPCLRNHAKWNEMRHLIYDAADLAGVEKVQFQISTIMPADEREFQLPTTFQNNDVKIYYSLYSMNPQFRRRWIPKSLPPTTALRLLAEWQDKTGQEVVLHWPFIAGENDDEKTLDDIITAVKRVGLSPRFNTVRYNPYNAQKGEESSMEIIERNHAKLVDAFGNPDSKIVSRVGYSAKASCGMFVEKETSYAI